MKVFNVCSLGPHRGRLMCVLSLFPVVAFAQAANDSFFFGASQTMANDSDVFNGGTTKYAFYETSGSEILVNDVVFKSGNSIATGKGSGSFVYIGNNTPSGSNFAISFQSNQGNLVIRDLSSSNTGAFSGLSTNYQGILGSSSVGGTAGIITFANLESGKAYMAQAWANSSESNSVYNTRYYLGATENGAQTNDQNTAQHTALKVNTDEAIGSVGQHFLTTFTAGGTSQAFNLACNNAIRFTAAQVRDVTGYWLGNQSGEWSDTAANFMGGMAFNNSPITSGGMVAFADLNLFEGTETFNSISRTISLNKNITVQTAGVSIGTVRFENNTDTYTFANASGTTGITGSTAVEHNGTGRVIFNAANTYTGGTTVNSGTLEVNNPNGSGTGTGTVTIAEGARLEGSGIINGLTTISGTHAPGNSPGTQTFGSGITYDSSSIFEWELTSNTVAGRGTSWDAVNLTGGTLTVDPAATFELVLITAVDFSDNFWKTTQTWSVFEATSPATISSVFQNFSVTGGTNYSASLGSFSMNSGGGLVWSAVPEPSSALAGLLLGAGLLHRRRKSSGKS